MGSIDKDILQPLSIQRLNELMKLYKAKSPVTFPFAMLMKNYIAWSEKIQSLDDKARRKLSDRALLKFYYAQGSTIESGTFVAFSNVEDPVVYFESLEKSSENLLSILSATKRIDWSCSPMFSCIADNHLAMLGKLIQAKGCEFEVESDCCYYVLPREKALAYEYDLPGDVCLKQLTPSLVDTMNESYPHRYPHSEKYISALVSFNGGLGLHRKDDNTLLGWVLKNEFAGVGHLYIQADQRRRGFGAILAKAMSQKLALEDDDDINVFIMDSNVQSIKLFRSIGFERIAGSNWIQARHFSS